MNNRLIKFRAWNGAKMHDVSNGSNFYIELTAGGLLLALDHHNHGRTITLMQFTGLKDRNGKEIYEGDIVRILYTDWGSQHLGTPKQQAMTFEDYQKSISEIGFVVWEKDRYQLNFGKNKYGDDSLGSLYEGTHGEKEIIGNIYSTPELLKSNS